MTYYDKYKGLKYGAAAVILLALLIRRRIFFLKGTRGCPGQYPGSETAAN